MNKISKILLVAVLLFITLVVAIPPIDEVDRAKNVYSSTRGFIFDFPKPREIGLHYQIDSDKMIVEIIALAFIGILSISFVSLINKPSRDKEIKPGSDKEHKSERNSGHSKEDGREKAAYNGGEKQKEPGDLCCQQFTINLINGIIKRERVFISEDKNIKETEGFFINKLKLDYCPFCGEKIIGTNK